MHTEYEAMWDSICDAGMWMWELCVFIEPSVQCICTDWNVTNMFSFVEKPGHYFGVVD